MNVPVRPVPVVLLATSFVLFALQVRIAAGAQGAAATTGVWSAQAGGRSWSAALRADGDALRGFVSSCASFPQDIPVADGRIEGDTVRFTCSSPDGSSTIAFVGRIAGETISFSWERRGSQTATWDTQLFGHGAPPTFKARRLPNRQPRPVADLTTLPPVTSEMLQDAAALPEQWLTYSGNYQGHR